MADNQEGSGDAGSQDLSVPASEPPAAFRIIDQWFVDQIHNSPASRDTAIFNHLREAVEDLKSRFNPAS